MVFWPRHLQGRRAFIATQDKDIGANLAMPRPLGLSSRIWFPASSVVEGRSQRSSHSFDDQICWTCQKAEGKQPAASKADLQAPSSSGATSCVLADRGEFLSIRSHRRLRNLLESRCRSKGVGPRVSRTFLHTDGLSRTLPRR